MKEKRTARLQNIGYFTFFLGILLFYNFGIVNNFKLPSIDSIGYAYHLVDYSFGFCTKLLPGAIYHLFYDNVLVPEVNRFQLIILIFIYIATAGLLTKLVSAQNEKGEKKAFLVLALFFLVGPSTLVGYTIEFGMIDVYWLVFTILFLVGFLNDKFSFLIPIAFVLSVMIHFSSVVSYILLFSLMILYKICTGEKKAYNTILLTVSLILAGGLTLYFLKNEMTNLTYTSDEFVQEMARRNLSGEELYTDYYEYALYRIPYYDGFYNNMSEDIIISPDKTALPAALVGIINNIWSQIDITVTSYIWFPEELDNFVATIPIILPALIFFFAFWINQLKQHKNDSKLLRFIYFVMMLQFIATFISGILFSPDISRWASHAFLAQFILVLYIAHKEQGAKDWITSKITSKNGVYIAIYYLFYSMVYMNPYC